MGASESQSSQILSTGWNLGLSVGLLLPPGLLPFDPCFTLPDFFPLEKKILVQSKSSLGSQLLLRKKSKNLCYVFETSSSGCILPRVGSVSSIHPDPVLPLNVIISSHADVAGFAQHRPLRVVFNLQSLQTLASFFEDSTRY